jgi:hypothetical protein
MQSEAKGVEEKQIHGWWIHLERFDGLRIASQAIPVPRESEWHCCSAKKKKNYSPAARIRSKVKKAWWWGGYGEHDIKVAQNHWFLEPQNRAELNPWQNTIRAEVGEEKTSRDLLERSFDIWRRINLEHC